MSRGFQAPLALVAAFCLLPACGPANGGVAGSTAVSHPNMTGTVFTIVMENHSAGAVLTPANPYISQLAARYGTADAYLANVHPSLPNYLMLTSGDPQGVGDDNAPSFHPIAGSNNLGDQLDAGHVPWRAYMESMGTPCKMVDDGTYIVHHDPWLYYTSMSGNAARCNEHVVDFDQNFATDLAADTYRYMWITPNVCDDMHNCDTTVTDAWLSHVIPQIQASPGYQHGGVIFVLWDEGSTDLTYVESYVFHRPQNVPALVITESIVSPGFVSNTTYGHDSYLATVEDMFGLPRLATTVASTPMTDFFASATTTTAGTTPVAPATGSTTTTPSSPTAP